MQFLGFYEYGVVEFIGWEVLQIVIVMRFD
jgi:hypothetical protein